MSGVVTTGLTRRVLALHIGPSLGGERPPVDGQISFVIPGEPVAAGRPRTRIVKPKNLEPFAGFYTPKKTKEYRTKVAHCFMAAAPAGWPASSLRCFLTIRAIFAEPKSTPKWKRALSIFRLRGRKPDAENVAKSIMDALNKVAYADDSQVVGLAILKEDGPEARCEVELIFIEDQEREVSGGN